MNIKQELQREKELSKWTGVILLGLGMSNTIVSLFSDSIDSELLAMSAVFGTIAIAIGVVQIIKNM